MNRDCANDGVVGQIPSDMIPGTPDGFSNTTDGLLKWIDHGQGFHKPEECCCHSIPLELVPSGRICRTAIDDISPCALRIAKLDNSSLARSAPWRRVEPRINETPDGLQVELDPLDAVRPPILSRSHDGTGMSKIIPRKHWVIAKGSRAGLSADRSARRPVHHECDILQGSPGRE